MPGTKRTKRSRVLLVFLLLIALVCVALWAVYIRPSVVRVTLLDGKIQAQPAVLRSVRGSMRYYAENKGTQPHQFIIIATKKRPNQLTVKNGVVQFFTEPGIETILVYDGLPDGGVGISGPTENPPLGPPLPPGGKVEVNYGYPGAAPGAETLILLCNLPGHFERGEFAAVSINQK